MGNAIAEYIRHVAACASADAESLIPQWLPDGARRGSEWVCRNPSRQDRHAGSFSVSLVNGCWYDFATAEGGDIVALAALIHGMPSQLMAADWIAPRIGIAPFSTNHPASTAGDFPSRRNDSEIPRTAHNEDRERRIKRKLAAARAVEMLCDASPATPEHPYLARKHLRPDGLYCAAGNLLIPLTNNAGEVVSVQTITPAGEKRFLPDGQVKGAFHVIGLPDLMNPEPPEGDIYICEGWATGAALNQYFGVAAVVCAMNAGNLAPVALALRERYGWRTSLVIAGDDDRESEGNPGATAANAAALVAGCEIAMPEWPDDSPANLSDFSDLMLWEFNHDAE